MAELKLKFDVRPSPVLAEHRPLYKISQLTLILWLASRGAKSSLPRLHLFNWALKSETRIRRLQDAASSRVLRIVAWGFDPALAIAIRFAAAEGLVDASGRGVALSDLGEIFSKAILEEQDVLTWEKEALRAVGKGVTEAMVEEAAKEWQP